MMPPVNWIPQTTIIAAETRKQYIADTKIQATGSVDTPSLMYCMRDRTGAGKPTIAHPCVEKLKDIQSDC